MSSDSLTTLALNALGCSQKELALRLGVSQAQISKWKRGEYMSTEMRTRLSELAGIGDRIPEFVQMAGSLEDAMKWERLLRYLANLAADSAETGYHTDQLENVVEADLLYWHTLYVLTEMGMEIPSPFPAELDFDHEVASDGDARLDELFTNPHVSLIRSIYKSYTDVYGFYSAYVSGLVEELDLSDPPACDLEPNLLALAAAKLEEVPPMAGNFRAFQRKTNQDCAESLKFIKEKAVQAGLPLRAELLDLVHETHDALGHEAEAESLGLNESRLHPDIYMNELLVGMRMIHQVLPVILKKLGIDQEFQLDESGLRLR